MTECRQVPQSGGLNSPVKKCSSDNTKTDLIDSERFSVEFEAEREKRRYQECGVADEGTDQFVTGMTAGLGRKEVAESATTHDIDPSNLMVAIGAEMGRAPVATNAGFAADTGAFMKGTSPPAGEAFIDDPLSPRSSNRPSSAESVNSDSRPALLNGDIRPGSHATANEETIDVQGLSANEDIGAPSGLVEVDKRGDLALKTKGVLLSTDTVHSEKTSGGLPAIPARDMSDYMNLSRRMASEGALSPRGFELTRNEGVDSTSSVVHGETPVSSVVVSRESSSSLGNTNISLGGLEFQRRDGPVSTVPTIPVTPIGVSESNSHRALGDGIIWMIRNSRGEAHFAVNPPDMGPISVSMSTRDDEVFIKMNVHDEATRVVVETGIARLRDALSNNGLALGNFEVDSREDGFESVERHVQRRSEDGDTSLVNEDETEKDTKNDNGDSLSEDDGLVDHYV